MTLSHRGKSPSIDPTASIAPTAVICGDVTIGAGTRIGFGAVLTAESGPITVGRECIVMEHAVLRGTARHPLSIADHCLVGPHAHLSGCTVERESFIATQAAIFNGAVIGEDADIRIGAVVQVGTVLPARTTVPIRWIAVGDPAQILPPDRHDQIGPVQAGMNFSKVVFGADRGDDGRVSVASVTARYARSLAAHDDDVLDSSD